MAKTSPEKKKPRAPKKTKANTKKKDTDKATERKVEANRYKAAIWGGGSIIVVLLVLVIGYVGFEYTYSDKVYPGVQLLDTSMSGKTYEEVVTEINAYKDQLHDEGITVTYNDHIVELGTVVPGDTAEAQDVSLLIIDTDATAQSVFAVGRSNADTTSLSQKITAITSGTTIEYEYVLNEEVLQSLVASELGQYESDYVNSTVEFQADGSITFTEHINGEHFNWDALTASLEQQLANGESLSVTMELEASPAPVPTSSAQQYESDLQTIIDLAPITFTYEDTAYEASANDIRSWLILD